MTIFAAIWVAGGFLLVGWCAVRYLQERHQRALQEERLAEARARMQRFLRDLYAPPVRPRVVVVPCDGLGVFIRASCPAEAAEIVALAGAFGARERVA